MLPRISRCSQDPSLWLIYIPSLPLPPKILMAYLNLLRFALILVSVMYSCGLWLITRRRGKIFRLYLPGTGLRRQLMRQGLSQSEKASGLWPNADDTPHKIPILPSEQTPSPD